MGPVFNDRPEFDKVTFDGMIDAVVILHAEKENKAADVIFDNLANCFPLKRSYVIPPEVRGDRNGLMWFQFGRSTSWRFTTK
jgi:hypothetical protein